MRVPKRIEQALDTALDKALSIEGPVVRAYLDRQRDHTPAEVVTRLEHRYLAAVAGIGGASGAAAAVPGAGTAASIAAGAAEITAFVSATALYVLALAELHQVPISDPEVRRALVLAVLVGEGGREVIAGSVTGEQHWAHVLGRTQGAKSKEKLGGLNTRLGRLLMTRVGARQGALAFGRALPLGIGAGVGALGNLALARGAIAAARKAFGPPPDRLPPRTIEG